MLSPDIHSIIFPSDIYHFIGAVFKERLKNLPADPPELDQEAVPWLPFDEDWSTGLFETNEWTYQQNGNWRIAGQVGNEAPSVEFYYNPAVTNYEQALTSRLLSAQKLLIDGDIFLSFNIKHTTVNPTGLEFMKVQVLADTSWITVWADSNTSSYDWTSKKLKISNPVKGNAFRFRFLAQGQNSLDIFNWLIDNISVYRECLPPLNLDCEVNFPNLWEVILTWDAPGTTPSGWLKWDNGINNDGIGLTDGGAFHVASRFTPAQLGEYAGTSLTTIRFFPSAQGTYELKVWTGENAGQLMVSQPLDSIVVGAWNEVELETPVYVSGTTELWFGYSVTHAPGFFPAGVDTGPAIAGFGDMISLNGSVWESMATAYSLNYNWNLQGLVASPEGSTGLIGTFNSGQKDKNYKTVTRKNQNARFSGNSADLKSTAGERELIQYNVYDCYSNDLILVGSTTETSYIFEPIIYPNGSSCFVVSAVYTDCEAFSFECGSYIPEPDKLLKLVEIYPVPADQTLTIKVNTTLISLGIFDYYYHPVYQIDNMNLGAYTINTSSFRNGVYMIRSIDGEGNISTAKIIVNH